jgi:hypothetical protein
MAGQRTYDDDDVRKIFALAARQDLAEPRPAAPALGLTLAELQDIGRQAGFDVTAVTRAAAELDLQASRAPVRRSLGMPIEVTRVVPLARAPTGTEWEQLVGELRSTFRARGRVVSQGGLREWVNGNLHASVEPSGSGYRLRLGTVKGNARMLNALGATSLFAGALALASAVISGGVPQEAVVPGMIAASGAAAFVANFVRLPRWAGERRRQMDLIAARVGSIMDAGPHAAE